MTAAAAKFDVDKVIPKNFLFYNEYARFDNEKTKFITRIMFLRQVKGSAHASACVDCGKCEEHCPRNNFV